MLYKGLQRIQMIKKILFPKDYNGLQRIADMIYKGLQRYDLQRITTDFKGLQRYDLKRITTDYKGLQRYDLQRITKI